MNKEIIAEFGIDIDDLVSEAQIVKKTLDGLREQNKQVAKSQGTSSRAFIENSAEIKKLNTQYQTYMKSLSVTTQSVGNLSTAEKALGQELDRSTTSIEEARESNKKLLAVRNQLDLSNEDNIDTLNQLNNKIQENNDFIKENVSELEQQKINVGNYKNSILESLTPLGIFNKTIEEGGSAGDALKGSLNNAISGMKGLIKSSLRFIATPIGAVLGAIVLAFALVKNAMDRNEAAANKITKVFGSFSGIVNALLKALEPLGKYLIDGIVVGFETAAKVAESAMSLISSGLNAIGFDGAAKSVDNFTDSVKKASDAGQIMAAAEANLRTEQGKSKIIQLEFQKNAEKLRQIRDDESKSMQERESANNRLSTLLKEQSAEEIRIANIALQVSKLRIEQEGETKEALDQQTEARLKISEINDRITTQESEQLVNVNYLRREGAEKVKKAQQDAIKQQETHLKLIQLISSVENTTIQEKQQSLKDVLAEELKIIDAKEKAGLSQDEAEIMRIEARQAALEGNTELILNAANKELEIYLLNNQHILDNEDNLNAEVLKKKKAFIDEKARLEIAALKAEGLSKDEYQAKRREIERQRDETKTQEDNDFKQAKSDEDKELEALAYEEKILLLEERDATEFEIKQERLIRDEELEVGALKQKLANKKITQEAFDAAMINIDTKAASAQADLDMSLAKAKIDNRIQILNAVSQIAGEESAVGKAAAISSATISTYDSATNAFNSLSRIPFVGVPLGIAAAAAAIGSGLANVAKITGVKTGLGKNAAAGFANLSSGLVGAGKLAGAGSKKAARGISFLGVLGGNSHANGGTDLGNGIEGERGENVYTDGVSTHIVNKKASEIINKRGIFGAIDYINQGIGNGVPLNTPTNFAALGGNITSSVKSRAKENFPSDEQQMFKVYNVAEETTSIVNDSIKVENEANL